MKNQQFRRLQIAALFLVAFLGLIAHVIMFNFESAIHLSQAVIQIVGQKATVAPALLEKIAGPVKEMANPSIAIMMFVFIIVSLAVIVLPLISQAKALRWLTAVLGTLMALMNFFDGAFHMFGEGEVIKGAYTFLISGGVGTIGTVLAFKWALMKDK
jgi:hypothetical protein